MTIPVAIVTSAIAAAAAFLIALVTAWGSINGRLGKLGAETLANRERSDMQYDLAEERAAARHAELEARQAAAEERALARHAELEARQAAAEERALAREAAAEERALARRRRPRNAPSPDTES